MYVGFVHWDLDPWALRQPVTFGLQGVLCLEDTQENQGGFQCVPTMHRWINQCTQRHTLSPSPSVSPSRTDSFTHSFIHSFQIDLSNIILSFFLSIFLSFFSIASHFTSFSSYGPHRQIL